MLSGNPGTYPAPDPGNCQRGRTPTICNRLTGVAQTGRLRPDPVRLYNPAEAMPRNVASPSPGAARRHVRFGWWSLFVFASLGLTLEVLHGFKVAAYLDVSNETRRLMWRLAHAHGVLLALVHVVYGLALAAIPGLGGSHARLISAALIGASVFLPGGFFLGGIIFYAGDPGLGIALVPLGACLLLVALFLIARTVPPTQ